MSELVSDDPYPSGSNYMASIEDLTRNLGLPMPVFNAAGPVTRAGSSRMSSEVIAAMSEAARHAFDMPSLNISACERIASLLDVPAGMVTSGGAAALVLGAAAAIARDDIRVMNRLPAAEGCRSEFLIARSHQNGYARSVCLAGARLIDVALCDRLTRAGVRYPERGDYEDAVTPSTAGILYAYSPGQEPSIEELSSITRANDLVLLVDAASHMTCASLPKDLINRGADLVAISAGKAIGGPAAAGFLLGRRDLIASALLQSLDMDYGNVRSLSQHALFRSILARYRRLPAHGVGRPMKVGKEAIFGAMAGLQSFVATSAEEVSERWRASAAIMRREFSDAAIGHRYDEETVRIDIFVGTMSDQAERYIECLSMATRPILVNSFGSKEGFVTLRMSEIHSKEEAAEIARGLITIYRATFGAGS